MQCWGDQEGEKGACPGQIDWNTLHQKGYKFVFTQATYGASKTDYWTRHKENVKEALDAGMFVGFYHFALPLQKTTAKDEAELFVKFFNELISELSPESKKRLLRPALDIELEELCVHLSPKQLTDWIDKWMNTVKTKTNVEPILYLVAPNFDRCEYVNNLEDSVAQYNLWIADTSPNITSPDIGIWKDWDFWQYKVDTSIDGVTRSVDLDWFNGDESELNAFIARIPNLKPYQPPDWSDKIVVSKSKGTYTDSIPLFPLYTTDTLYVDWAVINDGPVATPQGFSVALYVDGVLKKTWSLKACLQSNGYWLIKDYSIGKLSEGNHTLKIVADSTGAISEIDEEDNEYTKTITVQAPIPKCTFTLTTKINPAASGTVTKNPDKPKYCSGDVVTLTAVSNSGYSFKSWTGVDSSDNATAAVTMTGKRTITANFVKAQTGTLSVITTPVSGAIYVDDSYKRTGSWSGILNVGSYKVAFGDVSGYTTPPPQTVTVSAGQMTSVTGTYIPIQVQKPNLTPYQPTGWSDKIVVSNITGTNTGTSVLYTTDTLYVDWAVINNGQIATSTRFYSALYIDEVLKQQWYTDPPVDPGYYTTVLDFSIGSLTAGTHTIKIVADSTGVINESNEGDNEYTKKITVSFKAALHDDFSSDSQLWDYVGAAYRDTSNAYVVLTENTNWQYGIIWLKNEITPPFTAKFKYWAGSRTGADGIVMMFCKNKNYDYGYGGALGFNPYETGTAQGYGIEFDNYQNSYDPSERHIALIKDSVANHLIYVNDDRTGDNNWHDVTVQVGNSSVNVFLDGSQLFSWTGTIDTSYKGFGFSASTGLYSNLHIIDDVELDFH